MQTKFFGRKAQLDIIFNAFQKAGAGETQVVLVGGEPTIGKTALCNAFYNRLSRDPQFDPDNYWPDGLSNMELKSASLCANKSEDILKKWEKLTPKYVWLSAGCLSRSAGEHSYDGSPMQPWLDAIKGLEGKRCLPLEKQIKETLKQLGVDIAWEVLGSVTHVPLLKTILWDMPGKIKEQTSSHQTFDHNQEWGPAEKKQAEFGILNVLAKISNPKNGLPTIIFLDDLHWADTDSCRLLARLCEKLQHRLLILGTYRTIDLKTDTWQDAGGKPHYPPFHATLLQIKRRLGDSALTCLELGPLTPDAFRDFLKAQFEGGKPDQRLLHGLIDTMNGHPFFAEHFCKLLLQRGLITQQGTFQDRVTWKQIETMMQNGQLPPPGDVEDVIDERISRLNERLRQILACGSSMGLRFSYEFLLKALFQLGSPLKPLEMSHALKSLTHDHRLLDEINIQELDRFLHEFAHIMIYQSSLKILSPLEKHLLSEEVGLFAFERLRGESLRELSLIEIELLLECFAKALEVKKSIDFLQQKTEIDAETLLLDLAGIVRYCNHSGRWSLTVRLCQPIINSQVTRSSNSKELVGKLELLYANTLQFMGEYTLAKEIATRYVAHPNRELRNRALDYLILIHSNSNDFESLREVAELCIKVATDDRDEDLLIYGYLRLGTYYEHTHQYLQALQAYDQIFTMEREAEQRGQILTILPYSANLAPVYRYYGRSLIHLLERIPDAESYYLKALELDEQSADRWSISVDWNNLSSYYCYRGELEKALFYCEKEMTEESLYSDSPEWAYSYYNQACILFMLGNLEKASRSIFNSISVGEAPGGHQNYLLDAYFLQVCLSLAQQKLHEAKDFFEKMRRHFAKEIEQHIDPKLQADHAVIIKQAELVISLYQGQAFINDFKAQLDTYRGNHTLIDGCMMLGLSLLPSVRNNASSDKLLHDVAELLCLTAIETHNAFWQQFANEVIAKYWE